MKVTIIIPFYNEEKRIVLESFHQIFKNSSQYDFILVDDGSTDNTNTILGEFKNKFPNLTILKLDKNIGKAEAIRAAVLSISNTDFIAYYDADLATPFSELDKLILSATDLLGDTTHSSTEPQLCEPTKLEAERESESPTVDDADLQITINSILTDLAREDMEPTENGSTVITDSSTGIELLKYRTEPISHVGNVFKHNMQQSWIKSP